MKVVIKILQGSVVTQTDKTVAIIKSCRFLDHGVCGLLLLAVRTSFNG